ncbi:hypothetical protein A6F68_02321 [Tsuneonella dongtanensis]|uniref:Uncharacterized protein n=1 Tax=Tsuneonella dongtanensis TaxID=692370 RepID=A0A1B2AFD4_9SPHN|nr:hypothetical protein [Tsuneonella dongtanensis]ANY20821.1 hypothetical protein A6F68_02321 [Tsuneonella dongtanensis]
MGRAVPIIAVAVLLSGCETTNSSDWTGGAATPFDQAEKSCLELTESIADAADKRDFFIDCMGALGWTPNPGASVEL